MPLPLIASPYGRDTSATDRVRYGILSSGTTLLAEAAYRRLTTKRGTLLSDPDYGLALADYVNKSLDEDEINALPSEIQGELLKDPRLASVDVTVTPDTSVNALFARVKVEIQALASNGEGFALALVVDDVSAELLFLEAA